MIMIAATNSGLGRKEIKGLETKSSLLKQVKEAQAGFRQPRNRSKWLQIESSSGDLFDDAGFIDGLGRKLIKCIKTD